MIGMHESKTRGGVSTPCVVLCGTQTRDALEDNQAWIWLCVHVGNIPQDVAYPLTQIFNRDKSKDKCNNCGEKGHWAMRSSFQAP
jgi:hypothetical protein